MIVTCSKCSKRYMLDDILVPKDGRQVRCTSCQHVWRQFLDNPSSTSFFPFSNGPFTTNFAPSSTLSKKPIRWVEVFVFLAITVSCLNFLIFGRNVIMSLWPSAEKGYAWVGLSTTLPGAGLSVSNLTSFFKQEGATEMIVVGGDITNTSSIVRPLPPLKIKLNDDMSHVVDHWDHPFSVPSLAPGQSVHFETAPRPQVPGAQTIVVEF